jgi:predicted O-linked N-acetylglucosamine transferase (SPINDLY family)
MAGNMRRRSVWEHLAETDAACIANLERGQGQAIVPPWLLLNMPDLTPALQRKAAHDFATTRFSRAVLQQPPLVNAVARTGVLRIGYLSADYYDHATMHLMAGVLEAHDPARVEVHLLSINANRHMVKENDPYAHRIAAMPATFHDLASVSDAEAAERIAQIAPHLLIDLKGYTADSRTDITALRPAPVIVNWLGYPGTLGHERLADYIIGDPVVTPLGHASDFSETLALMPHCYQPNDRSRPLGAPPARQEEGLPENSFVFCCFNQFIKINPDTFDVWCRLLAATPGSVLWLLGGLEEAQSNLRREAQKRGIAGDRLVFAQTRPVVQHLARLQLADLALDTFPCNSHTTASDALWAGVPLVTRIGQTFASRVAASLLTVHGFPELIAQDDDAYFRIALSLVSQPEKLRQLRQKLDAARLASPLFDTVRFARDLERLYEAIWQQHNIPRDQRKPIVLPP